MKKMMFLSKNWYFSVQKALIYYTFNKYFLNSFILLLFSHVVNFRYVASFRFLTLPLTHDFFSIFCIFLVTVRHKVKFEFYISMLKLIFNPYTSEYHQLNSV